MINPISSIGAVLVPSFGSGSTSANSGQGSVTSEENKTTNNSANDVSDPGTVAEDTGTLLANVIAAAAESEAGLTATALLDSPEETAGTQTASAPAAEDKAVDEDRLRAQAIATQKRMLEDMMAESISKDPKSYALELKADQKTGSGSYAAAAKSGSASGGGQSMDMAF